MCTAKTGQQCAALLQLPPVRRLLNRPPSATQSAAIEVLVLCGKQGEQILQLGQEIPNVQFTVIDSSRHLPGVADDGTPDAPIQNVHVLEADSNPHTVKNVYFDIVLCVANYFGTLDDFEIKSTVEHVRRSLEDDGLLLIHDLQKTSLDQPENSSLFSALTHHGYKQSNTMQCMFTLRDSAMTDALAACRISPDLHTTPTTPVSKSEHVSVHDKISNCELSTFRHDALCIDELPGKGRVFLAAADIEPNTRLLVDAAYGIIPEPTELDGETRLLCSNIMCSRNVPAKDGVRCLRNCHKDVIWCNEQCRVQASPRHAMECDWLSSWAEEIEQTECRRDFGVMWLVIRLAIRRYLEQQLLTEAADNTETDRQTSSMPLGEEAINQLAGGPEWLDAEQLSTWTRLIEKYIVDPSLTHSLPVMPFDDWLKLLGQEETNSFGLYKGQAGQWPLPPNPKRRGITHGAAVYPLASVANHSCMPNVSLVSRD